MIFAIIDTNVIVSALLAKNRSASIPFQVLSEALVGDVVPIVSEEIMTEYIEVLQRPRFKFDPRRIKILIDDLNKRAMFVQVPDLVTLVPDQDDACFYNALLTTSSLGSVLITGNRKHFPESASIFTPTEFYNKFIRKD